jgi:hypothetical protein
MPTINVSVPHQLGVTEARRRIVQLLDENRGSLGAKVSDLQESWRDDGGSFAFKAMGFPVSGDLQVQPTVVGIELKIPFAALPLKGRIESELRTRAEELLS